MSPFHAAHCVKYNTAAKTHNFPENCQMAVFETVGSVRNGKAVHHAGTLLAAGW